MVKAKQTSTIKKHVRKTKQKTALAFVPKKENQFRPHLIRRYGLLLIISLVIAMQFGYNFTKTGSVLGRVTDITPTGLIIATNDERTKAGIPELRLSQRLSQAAMLKANDIIQNQYWDHTSPSGVEPWQWIQKVDYVYSEAGENLARDFSTANGTVAGWMASEKHRENMLKTSYSDVGFAVTTGELNGSPTTIIVALYAKPAAINPKLNTGTYTVSAAPVESTTKDSPKVLTAADRVGIAIQSLTPAAITSLALLFVSATVATTSHMYRRKLPKKLQKTWYKDHGVIKASGLFAIAAFILLLYGGGTL